MSRRRADIAGTYDRYFFTLQRRCDRKRPMIAQMARTSDLIREVKTKDAPESDAPFETAVV
jgi:hypothetical protein